MKSTGFSDVIRKSPFGPIKAHMEVSTRSVEELIQFIQYVIKKDWTEKFFKHEGSFYTYPAPDYVWQHDMSPPSEKFMDMENNTMKKISVVPKPYQRPFPPIHQVVDGIRSIEWAAQQGINIIMWIPTVKALKIKFEAYKNCLLYTSPSPRDVEESRMPSSA